jgi:hypothetical protein
LSDAELIGYLQACERQLAYATALAWDAAARVADRVRARMDLEQHGTPPSGSRVELAERAAAHEVACAAHVSIVAAYTRIERGEVLVGRLAPAAPLLRSGAITASHLAVLAEHTENRDPDLVADILARVLPRIGTKTPGQLGKALTRAEYALDPTGSSHRRREAAAARTGVFVSPGRDRREGMSSLIMEAPDHEAALAFTTLDTLARARLHAPRTNEDVDNNDLAAAPSAVRTQAGDTVDNNDLAAARSAVRTQAGDTVDNSGVADAPPAGRHPRRSLPQLRKAVLMDLLAAAAAAPDFPTQHGRRRIETQVVIDLPTLLGLRDNPAEINGVPVPAPIARELAAQSSSLRRLVTDPVVGHLLDVGRTYQPSQALTEFILSRDATCRVPGCHTRAVVTDLDHAIPYSPSGTTSAENLGALCRSHHSLKTAGYTRLDDSAADGSATWRTVLGQQLPIAPRPVLPDDAAA